MDIVLLRSQLEKHPPNINYIQKIVNTFKQGLFKFVPNKPEIHEMSHTIVFPIKRMSLIEYTFYMLFFL